MLWSPKEDDDVGVKYRFEFHTPENVESREATAPRKECWFAVKDILKLADSGPAMQEWLEKRLPGTPVSPVYRVLHRLFNVIREKSLVSFYEETDQKLERVLQIFVRTNSGGTALSYSDLLLSVAVAQWSKIDAREEIHRTVDELNKIRSGFDFSKDWVLKAGLMLSEIRNIGFKVENFNRQNMQTLEGRWTGIKGTLRLTVNLAADFGFNWETLRADSALLPIAYYLHVIGADSDYLIRSRFAEDRENIRRWLISSLLKSGVWGSGLDSLLTSLRQTIRDNHGGGFPTDALRDSMRRRGKLLAFAEEEIDALTDLRYGDNRTFPLLSLVFRHLDLRQHFHVDHIFPQSRFTPSRLRSHGFADDEVAALRQKMNSLPNLQLLSGPENQEKRSKMPSEWLALNHASDQREEYAKLHLLGSLPDNLDQFGAFHSERRERLRKEITQMLVISGADDPTGQQRPIS